MTGLFSLILIAFGLGTGFASLVPLGESHLAQFEHVNNVTPLRIRQSRFGAGKTNREALTSESLGRMTPIDRRNRENVASSAVSDQLEWNIPQALTTPPNYAKTRLVQDALGTVRASKYPLSIPSTNEVKEAGFAILENHIRLMYKTQGMPERGEANLEKLAGQHYPASRIYPGAALSENDFNTIWEIERGMTEKELIRYLRPLYTVLFDMHVSFLKRSKIDRNLWKSMHTNFMKWFSEKNFQQRNGFVELVTPQTWSECLYSFHNTINTGTSPTK